MFETAKWWVNVRGYANLWDWMRGECELADLKEFARDATHADLVSSYVPLGDLTLDQTMAVNTSKRAMIKGCTEGTEMISGMRVWGNARIRT